MRTPARRLIGAGLLAALAAGLTGWTLERRRFGASEEEALARVEGEVRRRFDATADALSAIAARLAADRGTIVAAGGDTTAAIRLFDEVGAALPEGQADRTGITIYDASGTVPLAWAGRTSDVPKERLVGPDVLFVAPGALGPRLVRVEPVVDRSRPGAARQATIVVERSSAVAQPRPGLGDTAIVSTALAPVSVRARFDADGLDVSGQDGGTESRSSDYRFTIRSPGGGALFEADVARADVTASREQWRARTRASVLSVLAITLLLLAGPILNERRRSPAPARFLASSAALAALLIGGRVMLRVAADWAFGPQESTAPVDLLLTALTAAGLVAVAGTVVEWRRVSRPLPRLVLWSVDFRSTLRLAALYAVGGGIDVWLLASYERVLRGVVSATALDVLHFSLHPVSAPRLAVAFGLVLLHGAVIWGAALVLRFIGTFGRVPRGFTPSMAVTTAWATGAGLGVAIAAQTAADVPVVPLVLALAAVGACAAALARLRARARHASRAARIAGLFLALLLPAIAMYPSLVAFAIDAKERLIAADYGPLALSQREDLKARLREALDNIDDMRALPALVAGRGNQPPTTDSAFVVWSRTALATYRITSAVELYAADGTPVSRFALNLPEYATTPHRASGCTWDLFDEPSSFGSSVRHVLTASRAVCERGVPRGSIVVRVMLDYTTLPFISSQSPYLESVRPERQAPPEGVQGRDVEFAVYGWSRVPIYASGTSVWPLPDDVFERAAGSRGRFWATVYRGDEVFRVFFLNDRGGIYALGYPVITWFGHLVSLAELVVLGGVLYVGLLIGAVLFNVAASRRAASGRALLREIRSSFYWKVFLASLAGSIVPVVILAVATGTYFAKQFSDGVNDSAAKTATVAQRLVEDYATLQQRGATAAASIDDQIMVLVGRAIDEDVNLYDRTRLQATSERDLFASGLLTTRTPAEVYRQIILEHLPTFVDVEQEQYLVAAAPVRAGGRDAIVSVPLPLRKQELERQVDELYRQVVFAAVLFSLLGAAIGYWMAERIADPVNRLSRATRRIASGDLNARIAAASADELGRLVQDFNRMAEDLQRQRRELERTQRLEAWADMARQVAHDIKNPLTPIQLSAEHARRINADRGRPLSPVLDECVGAILNQVALLRQIAAEFSSFASSPTARPEPTDLAALVEEVVAPYRTGLAGRIAIDADVAPDLPAALIDRTLFARALTNVIENALHAMPGHGALRIRARREAAPASPIAIEIADTGIGMDADAVKRIFEPYFSTKATGTGLGLTIAKRNIELNRGTIDVRSERGVGTTVTMTVPVA